MAKKYFSLSLASLKYFFSPSSLNPHSHPPTRIFFFFGSLQGKIMKRKRNGIYIIPFCQDTKSTSTIYNLSSSQQSPEQACYYYYCYYFHFVGTSLAAETLGQQHLISWTMFVPRLMYKKGFYCHLPFAIVPHIPLQSLAFCLILSFKNILNPCIVSALQGWWTEGAVSPERGQSHTENSSELRQKGKATVRANWFELHNNVIYFLIFFFKESTRDANCSFQQLQLSRWHYLSPSDLSQSFRLQICIGFQFFNVSSSLNFACHFVRSTTALPPWEWPWKWHEPLPNGLF